MQARPNRTNIVIGAGVPDTEVLLYWRRAGRAGRLERGAVRPRRSAADKMLAAVGLSRKHNIYIANIVKCRLPNNRDPLPDEQESCIKWLKMQVSLIKPKIIVCLGWVAACRIIDEGYKVTKQHGEFIEKGGVLMMAPSTAARCATPD